MDCLGLKTDFAHCLKHFGRSLADQLRRHGPVHWIVAFALLVSGVGLGHVIGRSKVWIGLRYAAYQFFLDHTSPQTPHPRRTAVVLITDDEFWRDPLAHRTPLKRDYLACLVQALDEVNPEVIALDVDLGSPLPAQGAGESKDYQEETRELLETVKAVARRRTVILTKPIRSADADGDEYEAQPAVFDGFNFDGDHVLPGYNNLPRDIRQVPLTLTLHDKSQLDSLASAVARADDEKSLEDAQRRGSDELPYGTFIRPDSFKVYTATQIFKSDPKDLYHDLAFKVVIVGGGRHEFAYQSGPAHDSHDSPVGEIFGAFIHANYVEALLGARAHPPISDGAALTLELIVGVVFALFFSLDVHILIKIGATLLLCVALTVISYLAWQNLGLFFDFSVPVILLLGHVIAEKILK